MNMAAWDRRLVRILYIFTSLVHGALGELPIIPFLGLLPVTCTSESTNITAAILPAINLGLASVNKHSFVLEEYTLQVLMTDTQVTFLFGIFCKGCE